MASIQPIGTTVFQSPALAVTTARPAAQTAAPVDAATQAQIAFELGFLEGTALAGTQDTTGLGFGALLGPDLTALAAGQAGLLQNVLNNPLLLTLFQNQLAFFQLPATTATFTPTDLVLVSNLAAAVPPALATQAITPAPLPQQSQVALPPAAPATPAPNLAAPAPAVTSPLPDPAAEVQNLPLLESANLAFSLGMLGPQFFGVPLPNAQAGIPNPFQGSSALEPILEGQAGQQVNVLA